MHIICGQCVRIFPWFMKYIFYKSLSKPYLFFPLKCLLTPFLEGNVSVKKEKPVKTKNVIVISHVIYSQCICIFPRSINYVFYKSLSMRKLIWNPFTCHAAMFLEGCICKVGKVNENQKWVLGFRIPYVINVRKRSYFALAWGLLKLFGRTGTWRIFYSLYLRY